VATEFGPGTEALTKWGAKPVDQATKGIIKVLDMVSMDNTGTFVMVPSRCEDPKERPWCAVR
jgi:hypothetical protein